MGSRKKGWGLVAHPGQSYDFGPARTRNGPVTENIKPLHNLWAEPELPPRHAIGPNLLLIKHQIIIVIPGFFSNIH